MAPRVEPPGLYLRTASARHPHPMVPMHSLNVETTLIALAVWSLGACTEQRDSASDSSFDSGSAKALPAADSQTAGAATTGWTVTPSGIGPIRVGMRLDEVTRVAGNVAPPPGGGCDYVRPHGLAPGVSVMLSHGTVARVDVDSAGIRTASGVGVGDSASRVNALYAGRSTRSPHKYVPGAEYLTVSGPSPADSSNRIVFEIENGRVARYRSGRVPEVEWVERCG
jgi:hypothetical protein